MNTPTLTPEQQLEDYQRAVEAVASADREHAAAVSIIIEQGREDFGPETFDSLAQDVADSVGADRIGSLMRLIAQTDAPVRVIAHLAENPDRAKKLATMTPGRAAAELGRIEGQLMPDGSGGGAEPAWVSRAKGGNKRGLGDDVDDKTWERNFKKQYYGDGGFKGLRR